MDLGAQLSEPSLEMEWGSRGVIWEWEGPRKTFWMAELNPGYFQPAPYTALQSLWCSVCFIPLSLQRGL